jgi:hypothetical protein
VSFFFEVSFGMPVVGERSRGVQLKSELAEGLLSRLVTNSIDGGHAFKELRFVFEGLEDDRKEALLAFEAEGCEKVGEGVDTSGGRIGHGDGGGGEVVVNVLEMGFVDVERVHKGGVIHIVIKKSVFLSFASGVCVAIEP